MALAMVLLAGLIVLQPDLGALVVIVAEIMGLLFWAACRLIFSSLCRLSLPCLFSG